MRTNATHISRRSTAQVWGQFEKEFNAHMKTTQAALQKTNPEVARALYTVTNTGGFAAIQASISFKQGTSEIDIKNTASLASTKLANLYANPPGAGAQGQVYGSTATNSTQSIGNPFSTAWNWFSGKAQDLWNTNIVGSEDIVVEKIPGGSSSTTTHFGANIFVPTTIYNETTRLTTTGWKLNAPSVSVGSMQVSAGLAWSGDKLSSGASVYDTRSGSVIEMSTFYDNKGMNVSVGSGAKTVIEEGLSVKTMASQERLALTYGEIAAISVCVTVAVLSFGVAAPESGAAMGGVIGNALGRVALAIV